MFHDRRFCSCIVRRRSGENRSAVIAPILLGRLRESIAEQTIGLLTKLNAAAKKPNGRKNITASIGVAEWKSEDGSGEETVARADRALYKAKDSGRNRVFVAEDHSFVLIAQGH